jgi:hypothetical protein
MQGQAQRQRKQCHKGNTRHRGGYKRIKTFVRQTLKKAHTMKSLLLSILFFLSTQVFSQNYFPLAVNNTWTYSVNSSSWSFFSGSTSTYRQKTVTIVDSNKFADTIYYFRYTVHRTDSVIKTTPIDFIRTIDTTVIRDTVIDTLKLFNNVIYDSNNRIHMKTQPTLGDTLVYEAGSTGDLSLGNISISPSYLLIVQDTSHFQIGDRLHKSFILREIYGFPNTYDKSLWYCEGIGFVASTYTIGTTLTDAAFSGDVKIISYHVNPSTSLERHSISSSSKLFTVSPNPFSSSIEIQASIPNTFPIDLKLYTINGQLVDNISMNAKSFNWKPKGLSKGTYILSIKTKSLSESKRILFVE